MRKSCRHSSNIPFTYSFKNVVAHKTEYLNNVSIGGLAFKSSIPIKKGTIIAIKIPLLKPIFKMKGKVVWCKKSKKLYDVGIKFLEVKNKLQVRMFEQVCFIEQYKQEVLKTEGRKLTGEEAAIEWINKYAKYFDE